MASELEEIKATILEMKTEIITAIQSLKIKDDHGSAVQWIKKYVKANGYITWSKVKDDSEFRCLVNHNGKFHRLMRTYAPILDWDERTIEGVTFYFARGHDIDEVVKSVSWQNFKPRDTKLLEMLIKEVIAGAGGAKVNVYKWLDRQYPQKSEQWRDDVVDALKDRVRGYYRKKVDFDGDDFWAVT